MYLFSVILTVWYSIFYYFIVCHAKKLHSNRLWLIIYDSLHRWILIVCHLQRPHEKQRPTLDWYRLMVCHPCECTPEYSLLDWAIADMDTNLRMQRIWKYLYTYSWMQNSFPFFFSQAMHFCFFNLSFYSIRHSSASISNRSVDIFTEVLKNLNENHSNAWRVNAFNLICYRSTFGNYV